MEFQEVNIVGAQVTLEIPFDDGVGACKTGFLIYRLTGKGTASLEAVYEEPEIVPWAINQPNTSPGASMKMNVSIDAGQLADPLGPFEMIMDAIKEHYKENPTHGPECACMDDHIRTVAGWLNFKGDKYIHEFPENERQALRAFHRVVHIALNKW